MISPESQGGPNIALITIVCSWTSLLIALLGVSLLLWVRLRIQRILGPDDYLTILALSATVALIAQTTWAIVDEGQDDHEAEISRTKFASVVRSLLLSQTLWGVINTLIRMNAVLFIERVFGVMRKTKIIARTLLVLSILYGLVVFLEVFLICRPMAVDWNAFVDGTCGDQIVSYLVLEVLGLLLDLTIFAVPIPPIWSLTMPVPSKISNTIVFSIGVLVSIITGIRIQALHMVNAQDFTYSKGYLGLLSMLGASLGITFCCAPAVPIVYRIWREAHASTATHINEPSLPMTEDRATQTHGRSVFHDMDSSLHQQRLLRNRTQMHARSAPWDMDTILHHLRLLEPSHKRELRAFQQDAKTVTAASGSLDEISLSTIKDDTTQTRGKSARWSMDDRVAGTKLPPHGGLHRHTTF